MKGVIKDRFCHYCKQEVINSQGVSPYGYYFIKGDNGDSKFYHPWCVEIEKLKKEVNTLKRINNVK